MRQARNFLESRLVLGLCLDDSNNHIQLLRFRLRASYDEWVPIHSSWREQCCGQVPKMGTRILGVLTQIANERAPVTLATGADSQKRTLAVVRQRASALAPPAPPTATVTRRRGEL